MAFSQKFRNGSYINPFINNYLLSVCIKSTMLDILQRRAKYVWFGHFLLTFRNIEEIRQILLGA